MGIGGFVQPGTGSLVIQRPADKKGQLFFKHPEGKPALHSQVVVDSDEICALTSQGSLLGVLPAGRYTLDTAAIPFLAIALEPGGQQLDVEAYFVTTGPVGGCKLGGRLPTLRDNQGGTVNAMVFVSYTVRVSDTGTLIRNLVASSGDPEVGLQWVSDVIKRLITACLTEWVMGGHFHAGNIAAAGAALAQSVAPHCGETRNVGIEVVQIDSVMVKPS
jgi:membrane protease subunit (stomatin/prohibitin family)